jgi:hypothetical protein
LTGRICIYKFKSGASAGGAREATPVARDATISTRALGMAVFACFCAGALYGWSALAAPLEAAFGAGAAQSGMVFSLALASFTAAVILAPGLAARTGALPALSAAAGLGALCTALAAVSPGFAAFVLCFSLGFGAMSGALYSTALGLAARSARPGLATPIAVAAFGLGGAVFGPAWRLMGARGWGLDALLPLSVLLAALALAATLARPRRRESPDAVPAPPVPVAPLPRAALARIWAIFALGSFGGLMVLGLAAGILEASGAGVGLAAAVLSGIAVGNSLGRLSVAALPRGAPPRAGLAAAALLVMGGLALCLLGRGPGTVGAGVVCVALGYGVTASSVPLATAAAVGPERFPRAFGLVFTAWGLAGFAAPWLAGALFEATGSFATGFALAFALTAAALPLIRRLGPARA